MYQLNVRKKSWPVAGSFRIAHGHVQEVHVVEISISDGIHIGRGECRPYARYGDTATTVISQIETIRREVEAGITTENLQTYLPAGAARNALDCALWDLKAKQQNKPIWKVLAIPKPTPRITAFTLSIDSPENMAIAAQTAKQFPVLKLKIDGLEGLDACLAVLHARPNAHLIIDANESLKPNDLTVFRDTLAHAPILFIEQPLKTGDFDKIDNSPLALPILCADESLHTRKDLDALWAAGYRAVNVKLDKCGGLTEALATMKMAKEMGFLIMSGCMVGTSLALAPMMALESYADFIDLDGPLLLAKDIEDGLKYEGPTIYPADPSLWG